MNDQNDRPIFRCTQQFVDEPGQECNEVREEQCVNRRKQECKETSEEQCQTK